MMKTKLTAEKLYFIALALYLWRSLCFSALSWDSQVMQWAYGCSALCKLLVLIALLVCLMLSLSKFSRKYMCISGVVWICTLLSYMVTHEDTLFFTAFFVMLAPVSSFEKILKVYHHTLMSCLVSIVVLNLLGFTESTLTVFEYGAGHTLGTGHPNVLAALVLNATLLSIYRWCGNHLFLGGLLAGCVAVGLWFLTVSRTSVILLVGTALLLALYDLMRRAKKQAMFRLLRLMIYAVVAGSFILMFTNGSAAGISDGNFNVRFSQALNIYRQYGIKLWGSDVTFVSMSEAVRQGISAIILDSGYLRLILYNGAVCFFLFVIGIISLTKRAARRRDYVLLIMITIFLISGVMEKFVFAVHFNFTLFGIVGSCKNLKQRKISTYFFR